MPNVKVSVSKKSSRRSTHDEVEGRERGDRIVAVEKKTGQPIPSLNVKDKKPIFERAPLRAATWVRQQQILTNEKDPNEKILTSSVTET